MSEKSLKPAPILLRISAFVVDMLILALVTKPFHDWMENSLFFAITFFLVYFSLPAVWWHATPGQWIFGLRQRRCDGSPLGYLRAFIQALVLWATLLAAFLLPYYIPLSLLPLSLRQSMISVYGTIALMPFAFYPALFTPRRQTLPNLLADICVVRAPKAEPTKESSGIHSAKKLKYLRYGVALLVLLPVLSGIFYMAFYLWVMGNLWQAKKVAYDRSFHTQYQTDDHNDSRIRFYRKELESSVKRFIDAKDRYSRFEADVQNDLAQNCIEVLLQKDNDSRWLDEGYAFYKEARNRYADTAEKIARAKKSEDLMGKDFYLYDLNDVHHLEEKIVDPFDVNRSRKICDRMIPVRRLYRERFISPYIRNREEALRQTLSELNLTDKYALKYRRFYQEDAKQQRRWLEELKARFPGYTHWKEKKTQETIRQKKQRQERERAEKIRRLSKEIWRAASDSGKMYPLDYFDEIGYNLRNDKGQTPLMVAVLSRNDLFITSLLNKAVDVDAKDASGKSAWDYLRELPADSAIEQQQNKNLHTLLEIIKVGQEVRAKHGRIDGYTLNNGGKNTLRLHGVSCSKIAVPKDIECLSDINKNKKDPLYTALRHNDCAGIKKALEDGADPNVVYPSNNLDWTPLFYAVAYQNACAVKTLLQHGASINTMDASGVYSPFTWAVSGGDRYIPIVKIFLRHGADVNFQKNGSEPALTFAEDGCKNLRLIRLLLEHGADPDRIDRNGFTPRDGLFRFCKDPKKRQEILKLFDEVK